MTPDLTEILKTVDQLKNQLHAIETPPPPKVMSYPKGEALKLGIIDDNPIEEKAPDSAIDNQSPSERMDEAVFSKIFVVEQKESSDASVSELISWVRQARQLSNPTAAVNQKQEKSSRLRACLNALKAIPHRLRIYLGEHYLIQKFNRWLYPSAKGNSLR